MSPPPDPFATRRLGHDGFTLIETLVAFAVMATLLSVLFRGVVTLRAGAVAYDARMRQDVVARSILDDAFGNRTLRSGTYSGTRDGLRWTMVARSLDLSAQIPASPAASSGPDALAPAPFQSVWAPQRVVVSVEGQGRPVEVETIRLVKAD